LRAILRIEIALGKLAAGTYHASRTTVLIVERLTEIIRPILSINLEWKRWCLCVGLRA